MAIFRVEGGIPLSGEVIPSGNKNEALPVLAASLLAGGPVTLRNVPRIGDTGTMIDAIRSAGASMDTLTPDTVTIDPSGIKDAEPDQETCARIRASFLLAGPLLARRGHVTLPRPGGDRIGRRRLDTHLLALEALGVEVSAGKAYHLAAPRGLRGTEIFLDEASVMATENVVMAAAAATGTSVIYNAACEPHVQGVCRMLVAMGARIDGIGSNVLTVEGTPELGGCEHRVSPDHIEIGSFIGLAAVTGGETTIRDVVPEHLRMIRMAFRRLGVETRLSGGDLVVPGGQDLEVCCDLGGAIPSIADGPWPAFPADLTSIALVTATRSRGTVLIHEKMFESRLFFVDSLIAMGAKIVLCDPHRAVVNGPANLVGRNLSSPDIRAGMALLIAALQAEGISMIHNIQQIDRGYEKIDERLRRLGARIERLDDCAA
ncbi:MAG: UDP-N-acetylglucosamine 1-carboxyvinyltransferase [Candidatus Eisenbacteria bacterium]|nr:UDP-N-acetylglucosamine 1-carboxyvinyltransferase [Candidatus Eisenbacteria bacterium]